jgi:hypothetical protein
MVVDVRTLMLGCRIAKVKVQASVACEFLRSREKESLSPG